MTERCKNCDRPDCDVSAAVSAYYALLATESAAKDYMAAIKRADKARAACVSVDWHAQEMRSRETVRRLNRRCQAAESIVSSFRYYLEHDARTKHIFEHCGKGYASLEAAKALIEEREALLGVEVAAKNLLKMINCSEDANGYVIEAANSLDAAMTQLWSKRNDRS